MLKNDVQHEPLQITEGEHSCSWMVRSSYFLFETRRVSHRATITLSVMGERKSSWKRINSLLFMIWIFRNL